MAHYSPSLVPVDPQVDLFEMLPHDVALLDPSGHLEQTNRRWATSIQDPLVAARPGTDILAHLAHLASIGGKPAAIAEHLHDGLERVLAGRSPRFELQYQIYSGGTARWFLLAAAARPDGGAVVTHTDTTVHHSVQDVLAEMAFHDSLTGLPNRTLVVDRLRMALNRAQRNDVFPAIIFIDLDGFKSINDTYGHAAGDEVLVRVGERLGGIVRDEDTCGRWGGDEFVLLLDLADPSAIESLLKRTHEAFADPLDVDGHSIELRLSMGVVISRSTDTVADLVRKADEAMYEAKRSDSDVSVVVGSGTNPWID